jgi:hypothetical protein
MAASYYYSSVLNHVTDEVTQNEFSSLYQEVDEDEVREILEYVDETGNYLVWNSIPNIFRKGMSLEGEQSIHKDMLNKHYNS